MLKQAVRARQLQRRLILRQNPPAGLPVPADHAHDQPLTEALVQAMAARIYPRDVVPIPPNEMGSASEAAAMDAGRYVEAAVPNEQSVLTRQAVKGWNDSDVPKVGPIDMLG